jgi:hypothetical protein
MKPNMKPKIKLKLKKRIDAVLLPGKKANYQRNQD